MYNKTIALPILPAFLLTLMVTFTTACQVKTPEPTPLYVNKQPVAVISPDSEQSVFVGDTLIFSGSNSYDPDANIPLNYEWTVTGSTTSIQTSTQPILGAVTFSGEGVAVVHLKIIDSAGIASAPTSVVINVAAQGSNRPPNGRIFYQIGNASTPLESSSIAITTNTVVTFSSIAIDQDINDTVDGFEWTILPSVATDPVTPGSNPFTATFTSAGIYDISLIVVDNLGNRDPSPANMIITVTDTIVNKAPESFINFNGGNSGNFSITKGDSVTFTGSATDPDVGDTYSSSWEINPSVGVSGVPSSNTRIFTATFDAIGNYILMYTATDNNGNVDLTPASVTITVNDPPLNMPPNGVISHDNSNGSGNINIATGTTVVFTGAAIDLNSGNTVAASYSWGMSTTASTGVPSGIPSSLEVLPVLFDNVGNFTLNLIVTDSLGNTDPTPAVVVITVNPIAANQPPTGTIIYNVTTTNFLGDIMISANDNVTFNTSGMNDPEGDPISYAWTIQNGSAISPVSNFSSGPVTVNFPVTGRFSVSLLASDNQGNTVAIGPSPLFVSVTQMGGGGPGGGGPGGGGPGGGGPGGGGQ